MAEENSVGGFSFETSITPVEENISVMQEIAKQFIPEIKNNASMSKFTKAALYVADEFKDKLTSIDNSISQFVSDVREFDLELSKTFFKTNSIVTNLEKTINAIDRSGSFEIEIDDEYSITILLDKISNDKFALTVVFNYFDEIKRVQYAIYITEINVYVDYINSYFKITTMVPIVKNNNLFKFNELKNYTTELLPLAGKDAYTFSINYSRFTDLTNILNMNWRCH